MDIAEALSGLWLEEEEQVFDQTRSGPATPRTPADAQDWALDLDSQEVQFPEGTGMLWASCHPWQDAENQPPPEQPSPAQDYMNLLRGKGTNPPTVLRPGLGGGGGGGGGRVPRTQDWRTASGAAKQLWTQRPRVMAAAKTPPFLGAGDSPCGHGTAIGGAAVGSTAIGGTAVGGTAVGGAARSIRRSGQTESRLPSYLEPAVNGAEPGVLHVVATRGSRKRSQPTVSCTELLATCEPGQAEFLRPFPCQADAFACADAACADAPMLQVLGALQGKAEAEEEPVVEGLRGDPRSGEGAAAAAATGRDSAPSVAPGSVAAGAPVRRLPLSQAALKFQNLLSDMRSPPRQPQGPPGLQAPAREPGARDGNAAAVAETAADAAAAEVAARDVPVVRQNPVQVFCLENKSRCACVFVHGGLKLFGGWRWARGVCSAYSRAGFCPRASHLDFGCCTCCGRRVETGPDSTLDAQPPSLSPPRP